MKTINYADMLKGAGIDPVMFLNEGFNVLQKIFNPSPTEYWLVRYDLGKVKDVHRLWESKEARTEVFPFASKASAIEAMKQKQGVYPDFFWDIEEASQPEIEEPQETCAHNEDEEAGLDPEEIDRRFEEMRKAYYVQFLSDWEGKTLTVEALLGAQKVFREKSDALYTVIIDIMRKEAKEKPKS